MKKITLLIALAIFSFCWQSSAQVQIGNGNYEALPYRLTLILDIPIRNLFIQQHKSMPMEQ